jgi:hypothetical protein
MTRLVLSRQDAEGGVVTVEPLLPPHPTNIIPVFGTCLNVLKVYVSTFGVTFVPSTRTVWYSYLDTIY